MGKDAGLARPGTLNGLPIADRLNPPERSAVFDPTFEGIGWGHKRNLRPENARAKEEAYLGKRVFEAPSSSQTGDLMRSSLPILDVHARGGARQTRFTKGFNRKRPHETPEQAALKEQIHQHAADRAHTVQSNRRDYLATKASKGGCNVVTGGPPIAGEHLSYKPARLILKPKATIDKELGTADRQKELDSKHLEMAEKRRERLRCDVCSFLLFYFSALRGHSRRPCAVRHEAFRLYCL